MLRFLGFALALLAVPVATRTGADKLAPSITMKALDGSTVRLSQTKGRVVLVDFWASWCVPCKASFPALNALAASMRERGVEIFAVTVDENRKDADAFLSGQPHSMRVLLDPEMTAAEAFKVDAIPTAFIIDRQGRIRYTHPGYTGEAIDIFRHEIDTLLEEPRE